MLQKALKRRNRLVKLKDIYIKFAPEKNLYRGIFFFNFKKFRKKKWRFHRSRFLYESNIIFRRFAPNITYIPKYTALLKEKNLRAVKIRIKESFQILTYRSRLELKRKVGGFFSIRRLRDLRRMFVFRHMSTHFNIFDSSYEVMLLRLGLADTIKDARDFISCGILNINGHNITKSKHLNHLDYVHFEGEALLVSHRVDSYFSRKQRKWVVIQDLIVAAGFPYTRYLVLQDHDKAFVGCLPFTFPVNYRNMNFIYFNILMKNQWHFFLDFFVAKKFLHYNR